MSDHIFLNRALNALSARCSKIIVASLSAGRQGSLIFGNMKPATASVRVSAIGL